MTAEAVSDSSKSTSAEQGGRPIRLCIIVTVASTLRSLYRNQYQYLADRGFAITVISSPGEAHEQIRDQPIEIVPIPMMRQPSPGRDVVSLVRLWWHLLWNRYDIVHVSTPKAILLGTVAARLSGHGRVMVTMRGRAYENMQGVRRKVFASLDRLACMLGRRVLALQSDLAEALAAEGICPRAKLHVIGAGSSNGIDLNQFSRSPAKLDRGRAIRTQFQIPDDALVILNCGRLRREKGVNELVTAFEALAAADDRLHLLLVGKYEHEDPLRPEVSRTIETHPRIHYLGWQDDLAGAYAAADIVAFPTYREGFGNVTLEAAAMELPTVASDIPGCRSGVVHEKTGLLVPMQDAAALRDGLARLIDDPALRQAMGQAGRKRVEAEFRQEVIWDGLIEAYRRLLNR